MRRRGNRAIMAREASMNSWRDRIELNPAVLAGKPVVHGTRLAVEMILEQLAAGETEAALLDVYPGLTADDLHACVAYAADIVRDERVYPRSA